MIIFKRGLLLVAALGLLAMAFSVLGAQQSAQAGPSVPSTAVVDPAALSPNIECKWELPDMQPGVIGTEFPDPFIQYGTALDAHQHDDDMTLAPTPNPACSGPPLADPSQLQGATHMIQVRPLPGNLPEQRRVQLGMAVDHPAGTGAISGVYWHIFHPDGTFKIKVTGVRVPVADCTKLGSAAGVGTMFEAAVHTGQLSAASVDDPGRGMVRLCQQDLKAIFYSDFAISKDQPCGQYKIEAHATSAGNDVFLTNYIDVLCFWQLQIDFNTVDWGKIVPGIKKVVGGDFIWDVPPGNRPTVRNVGNHGMGLGVAFSRMCRPLAVDPDPTCLNGIDQFDACFARDPGPLNPLALQCIDPIPGPPPGLAPRPIPAPSNFDDTRDRTLCSDEQGKLDLSVHPPSTLPNGTYTGTVYVYGHTVHNLCPTDQGPLGPHTAGGIYGP